MLWRKFRLDWTYAVGELVIVVDGALRSPIREQVIAEMNLARFIHHLGTDINQRCKALIARIETYRAAR